MIGLGKWEIPVNCVFYRGTAYVTVGEKDGEYTFDFDVPRFSMPVLEISDIEVNGSELSAKATCAELHGKKVSAKIKFEGDKCTGAVKGPFGIQISVNGKRVEE